MNGRIHRMTFLAAVAAVVIATAGILNAASGTGIDRIAMFLLGTIMSFIAGGSYVYAKQILDAEESNQKVND